MELKQNRLKWRKEMDAAEPCAPFRDYSWRSSRNIIMTANRFE
jgi:hypothetical protein